MRSVETREKEIHDIGLTDIEGYGIVRSVRGLNLLAGAEKRSNICPVTTPFNPCKGLIKSSQPDQ